MDKMKAVAMGDEDLAAALTDGVWYPNCPYCGCESPAEPDAQQVCCQECDKHFRITGAI